MINYTNDWNTDNHPLVASGINGSNSMGLYTGANDLEDEIRKKVNANNFNTTSGNNGMKMWGFYYTDS